MKDSKAKLKTARKKDLERKKFLLGNAFLALSTQGKKEFSSELLLILLQTKAKTTKDKKLVEELRSNLPDNFVWKIESSGQEIEDSLKSIKKNVKELENSSSSHQNSLKCLSDENISADSKIKNLQTNGARLEYIPNELEKLKTFVIWFAIISVPHVLMSLYMFFLFKIPAQ